VYSDFISLHEHSDQGTPAKASFALGCREGLVFGKANMVARGSEIVMYGTSVLDAGGGQITESLPSKETEAVLTAKQFFFLLYENSYVCVLPLGDLLGMRTSYLSVRKFFEKMFAPI
jgi:hypothetical protein